jgi:hypothetical protein
LQGKEKKTRKGKGLTSLASIPMSAGHTSKPSLFSASDLPLLGALAFSAATSRRVTSSSVGGRTVTESPYEKKKAS